MYGEGGSDTSADQLQPERFVEGSSKRGMVPSLRGTATDYEAVTAMGMENLFAEVLNNRFAHTFPEDASSGQVLLEIERAFIHPDIGMRVKLL